jgi:hypothetical protein
MKEPSVVVALWATAVHRFVRPLRLSRLAAQAGPHLQARNAQPVMRQLLVEHAQVASQFASIALRFLFEAAKRFDELVDLDFRTVRQSVDPLKPNREGNTKRDRHTGTGADRNPSFGRHENVALRMKKPALRSVFATRSLPASVASTEKLPVPTTLSRASRKKKRAIAQHRFGLASAACGGNGQANLTSASAVTAETADANATCADDGSR